MHEGDVFTPDAELELSEGFDVWCGFNIANRPSKFNDASIRNFSASVRWLVSYILYPFLDRIGHMRDHLNRFTEVVTPSFCFNDF